MSRCEIGLQTKLSLLSSSLPGYTDADDMVTHLCFVSFETIHSLLGIDKYFFFTIIYMRFFTLFFMIRYFFIFFWFRVIFVHLVPCSALVWLNYHLAVALRRADQRRRRLHDRCLVDTTQYNNYFLVF